MRDRLPAGARRPLGIAGLVALVAYGVLAIAGLAAAASWPAALTFGPAGPFGAPIAETVTLNAPLAAGQTLHVRNTGGRTTIRAAVDGVCVTATTHRWRDDQTIDVRLTPGADGLTLAADAGPAAFPGGWPYADYAVEVPAAAAVDVDAASGDVENRGVSGAVNAATASGDVTVADAAGPVTVRTASGAVRLSNVAGELRGDRQRRPPGRRRRASRRAQDDQRRHRRRRRLRRGCVDQHGQRRRDRAGRAGQRDPRHGRHDQRRYPRPGSGPGRPAPGPAQPERHARRRDRRAGDPYHQRRRQTDSRAVTGGEVATGPAGGRV